MPFIRYLRRALVILALAGPAWGQTPPAAPASDPAPATDAAAPIDPDHEIQIIAHLPGPALWRVATPKSELWIIGMTGPAPKRLDWDTRRIDAALDGARELVIPPGASINLFDIAGLLLDPAHRYHYPGGQTLRAALSPDARTKFEEAARSVGQDPAHYDHWRPIVTAIALLADAQKHDALNPEGPQKTLMHLAAAHHVPTRRLTNYSLGELLKALGSGGPQAGDTCLDLVTDLTPRLPDLSARMGAAWARGDVDATRAVRAEITSDRCFTATPGLQQLQDRMTADWARGLAQTLQKPGKTVLAIDMESLTRAGGLLEQLRAQGLDVTGRAY
ncbi:MAG TPA: TraB/GumN family protein [Caulobacteraceae bacterium]|nr:TraB/GumN family protein [Caulobacteraceae bacterium]